MEWLRGRGKSGRERGEMRAGRHMNEERNRKGSEKGRKGSEGN